MTLPRPFTRSILIGAVVFCLGLLALHTISTPSKWNADDVTVAFWVWRTHLPESSDVTAALSMSAARHLFVRSGQFDIEDGDLRRIRPSVGTLPQGIELHLVYNSTRRLLADWEMVDANLIAERVANTYLSDVSDATSNGVSISGIQLDFDVPTRSLPKYETVIRKLRGSLPIETKISITGLPTWMGSDDINTLLLAVDFWVPQFYGGKAPLSLGENVSVSSANEVKDAVIRARRLGRPFYAGLAAFGYLAHYDRDGSLVELRGDIDPSALRRSSGLELLNVQNGRGEAEIKYEFRADRDLVIDGLAVTKGETLVAGVPTAASLRSQADIVRTHAGKVLLGLCIFRLPMTGDDTTLTIEEIAAALNDTSTQIQTRIDISTDDDHVSLGVANTGSARTVADGFIIDLRADRGSIDRVAVDGDLVGIESLCTVSTVIPPGPCLERRADLLRVTARNWKPKSTGTIRVWYKSGIPNELTGEVSATIDDGRVVHENLKLNLERKK